jgi:hypothetical protein
MELDASSGIRSMELNEASMIVPDEGVKTFWSEKGLPLKV